MRHTHHIAVGMLVLAAVFASSGCWSHSASSGDEVRTFELQARDGQFVMDGAPNPTLRVERGETVQIVFHNTESGVQHALSVPPFVDRSHQVRWGEKTAVTFTPDRTGTFTYQCGHHVPVMKGKLVVRSEASSNSKRVAQQRDD